MLSPHWGNILGVLDGLLAQLKAAHVPAFLVRKLFQQLFSFVNVQLFNQLLLRRECCSFSNVSSAFPFLPSIAECPPCWQGGPLPFRAISLHQQQCGGLALAMLSIRSRSCKRRVYSNMTLGPGVADVVRLKPYMLVQGEYVKTGLAEVENWIASAGKDWVGESWEELRYIRQV